MKAGDVVKVKKVLEVDAARKRIALTMPWMANRAAQPKATGRLTNTPNAATASPKRNNRPDQFGNGRCVCEVEAVTVVKCYSKSKPGLKTSR